MESRRSTADLVAITACAALAVGSIGAWEDSLLASPSGLEGAGIFTLLLAAMAALLLVPRTPWPLVSSGLGLVAFVVTTVNVVDVAGSTREAVGLQSPSVEVGWGLWVSFLASATLAVSALLVAGKLTGGWAPLRRPRSGVQGWIARRPAVFGLLVLLTAGLLLRVWLTLAWNPAFTGYSDSGIYFQGAFESIWSDPIRMAGYAMFLHGLHAITPHLLAVVVAQHALGLVAAALMFVAVRRCGGPTWLGLLPAAVLALGGDELFLEHAVLSDALFVFLVIGSLYATVRASQDRLRWGAVAGAVIGLSVWDRTVGIGLLAVMTLWLLCSRGRPTRRTLALAGLCLTAGLVTIGAYAVWRSAATDLPGTLTSNNAWNLYGRVAPWADCARFTPPEEAQGLCQQTPFPERGYHSGEEYIYSGESPAQRLYGPPYVVSPVPHAMERLQEWSEAAIRGQPLDYLNAVWLDTRRLFSPNSPSYGDLSADALIAYLLYGANRSGTNEFVETWQSQLYPHDPPPHHGDVGPFKAWEAITRIVNLWMAALLLLCAIGPWVLSGRARAGMVLFGVTALVLLFFPIVSKGYDYRFTIPAYAPLVAAGALAGWGVVQKVTRALRRRRSADAEPAAAANRRSPAIGA